MKATRNILLAVLAVLAVGCPTRSVYPLFTQKDLATLPGLAGTWIGKDGDQYLFQTMADKTYEVVCWNNDGSATLYKAQLGSLGKAWFLDSTPAAKGKDHHLIAAHIITKIRLEGDSLRLSSLEDDWLSKMIESGKVTIAHTKIDNDIILIATTPELQTFVQRYADDESAFPKTPALVRQKGKVE